MNPGEQTILAIESSCDETAAAVVRGRTVLSSIVSSQHDLHGAFGGVVPEIASRRHLEVVDAVIDAALEGAGLDPAGGAAGSAPDGIDAIAVTSGPGLIGALLVGLAAAKARAWAWDVPLITVDHLVGHVASAVLAAEAPDLEPPFLCVLASGGHTMLLDVAPDGTLELLGTSRDDAAGEAFDKAARLLGLEQPGGPAIQRAAEGGQPGAVAFTPAMVHHDTLDTSFAGLKTALAVHRRAHPDGDVADVAAGFQHAVVETIAGATRKLLRQRGPRSGHPDARHTLAVVGGVAANALLRARLEEICRENDVTLVRAPLAYCGDNAVMIGLAAQWSTGRNPHEMVHADAFASSPLFRSGTLTPTPPGG